ncbi:hypothetical protein QNN00_14380 [Bacillus velezensis]|nr:hypothetical protein [Bacillus velezensis]
MLKLTAGENIQRAKRDSGSHTGVQTIEGGRTMKFYEIHDPYYALIKATDKADAEKVYIESVADTDDYENFQEEEIREVERDYALVMFSQIQDHDGTCAGYGLYFESVQ